MKYFLSLILFSFAAISLGGCSSAPQSHCAEADWFEIGRRAGASGSPVSEKIEASRLCPSSDILGTQALYQNGYQAGLLEYCLVENAYELGRSGERYYHVCPVEVELDFFESFKLGRRIYLLEGKNQSIDSELKQLYQRLGVSKLKETDLKQIRQKIQKLRLNRAQNNRELSKIKPPTS